MQPRSRNKISKTGIGTPSSHSKTHPTFPASRAAFFFFIQIFNLSS